MYGEALLDAGRNGEVRVLGSNLASLSLLRHDGRTYASMLAPGVASHVRLGASGAGVDVAKVAAAEAGPGELAFGGLQAVLEVEAGGEQSVPLLLRLEVEDEARHWRGWPRSFSYSLSGFVLLRSLGVWRLLAEVQGSRVFDGQGAFLEGFSSAACGLSASVAVRYSEGAMQGATQAWRSPGFAAWPRELRPHVPGAVPKLPSGDNSPAGSPAALRPFGPRAQRLDAWGQALEGRAHSCVTANLAAVMADPLQYSPPPHAPVDWSDFCRPLLAEHLWWTPKDPEVLDIEWFYNEITVEKSAPSTYFMANGFQGGYFGIQEHAGGKKYALFSVWDAGSKVEIVDWGEAVQVGRFGLEGTGANSHVAFPWEIGEPVRFLVHVQREGNGTLLHSGYVHCPWAGVWRLLSRLRVRPCGHQAQTGGRLLGLNSFIEVFGAPPPRADRSACSAYGQERRARYGTPWFKRASASAFEPFAAVTFTATCPEAGCPREGLGFQVAGTDAESFTLLVGANVTNNGLPFLKPRRIGGRPRLPTLLGSLPDSDNSPAGTWRAGESRPLRALGKEEALRSWGSNKRGELPCPWYVAECGETLA